MTTAELVAKFECFITKLEENRPLAIASSSAHAAKCERIFTKGENSNGGRIGNYNSTNPIYVNPNDKKRSPVTFQAIGKNGDKIFKSTGKPHKTKFFGSYKDFRSDVGRESNFVNLLLFGNLKSNYENNSRGFIEAEKVSNNEYRTGLDKENSLKKSGAEEKYGTIFKHTSAEIDLFNRVIGLELRNELSKC